MEQLYGYYLNKYIKSLLLSFLSVIILNGENQTLLINNGILLISSYKSVMVLQNQQSINPDVVYMLKYWCVLSFILVSENVVRLIFSSFIINLLKLSYLLSLVESTNQSDILFLYDTIILSLFYQSSIFINKYIINQTSQNIIENTDNTFMNYIYDKLNRIRQIIN